MNTRKAGFVAALAAALVVPALAHAAAWIAYPGDYALWTGNELMPKRIERGTEYPPLWPGYMHHPGVDFYKDVDLAAPVTAKISAKGRYLIMGYNQTAGVKDGVTVFPKGKYRIAFRMFDQHEPPALKVEGPGVETDGSWTAACYAGTIPAETFAADPTLSPLQVAPQGFAKVEPCGTGLFADLGREDFGFLTLAGVKGAGMVRVLYGESEGEVRETDERRMEAWEWVKVKAGDNRLPVSRGWRYVRVAPEAGVTVAGLRYAREFYPLAERGRFSCNDERLNKIWQTSRYTLGLTFREIPVEGIKRDRWTWSGDAIQSFLMNYYVFGETKPVRDALWYLRGGDPVARHINHIMDYTFYWFVAVGDYWKFTGDLTFIKQVYPRMLTLADFVIGRLDKDGRPHDRPGDWMFIDWAPEALHNYGGVTSFETMLLARAFDAVAETGAAVGDDPKRVAAFRARAAKLRAWVKPTFWDDEKGGLWHLLKDDGTMDPQFTRYPNIFGLLYGYFTRRETTRVFDEVIGNDKVMKLQTPYMRFYELEALAMYGHGTKVLGEIRSYWGAMLDHGATTFWELYNPSEKGDQHYAMYGRPYGKSLCHAWGASPAYLLGRYFLGVEPTKPGFAEYVVEPELADLKRMEGAVPTPTGAITVVVEGKRATVTGNGGRGTFRWLGCAAEVAPHATVTLEP